MSDMTEPFDDPLAVAQANFFMLRNLLKWLVMEGPMEPDRLAALLCGTIKAAETSGKVDAAEILRGLRHDLNAYD